MWGPIEEQHHRFFSQTFDLRHLIRTFVLKVLKDYGALLLGLLLLASMYRVPAMVRGFCRENHSMLTHRVRLVLTCQARHQLLFASKGQNCF